MKLEHYLLVADGACRKNPGPGGYGTIVVTPEGQVSEWGGHEAASTNNRMELMGFYRGLQEVYKLHQSKKNETEALVKKIHFISDSKYVLDGARKSLGSWSRNGWKTQAGTEVKNKDLWEKILKGLSLFTDLKFQITYEHVLGHKGHEANERVDQIAVKYSHNEPIDLYCGPLENYSVSLEKGAVFQTVYLSYVNGILERHRTWEACQKATHGKAAAKFKKVTNRAEETETLKGWGLS